MLKARLREMQAPPKINAFGHMHGEYGVREPDYMKGIKFINCSLVDESYEMTKLPIYLEL